MKQILAILVLLLTNSTSAADNSEYWSSLANEISVLISKAEQHYKQGEQSEAKRTVVKAYFGVFEDKKMEAAMRVELGASYTYKVEKKFGTMRKLISKKAPYVEIKTLAEHIVKTINSDAKKLDKAGIPPEVFAVNQ